MTKGDGVARQVGELFGLAIGWVFLMAILAGAYFLGYTAAHYFSGGEHQEAFGLLSALAVIWMYEHERANERWTRLLNRDS